MGRGGPDLLGNPLSSILSPLLRRGERKKYFSCRARRKECLAGTTRHLVHYKSGHRTPAAMPCIFPRGEEHRSPIRGHGRRIHI
jgi:hypothetical protein